MQTIWGIENYHHSNQPTYLALGNFDGVHKGHQFLIQALIDKTSVNGGQSMAFIFEPHPAQVLTPESAPRLLLCPEGKAKLLAEMGLDILIYNPFTREIAGWSPEQFVQEILIKALNICEVFVGFNYSFGHRGAGTPADLQRFGQQYGFGVNIIEPVEYEGETISSSLIRKYLELGEVSKAATLLGYLPFIQGKVVEGEHRGTQLGYPTANVGVESIYHIPGKGVYAARAVVNHQVYHCVVNIGSKPTFHDEYPISIEAHLMGFTGDIYQQDMRICFMRKIRDERQFSCREDLIKQIALDRDEAMRICIDYKGAK